MIACLVRKELREQLPFVLLGLLLSCLELLEVTLSQIDTHSLSHGFSELGDASVAFQILLSFAVGTGLLVREQDDGTLRFLDGLPLTRRRLFTCKVAVALAVLMLYPSLRVGLFALLHLGARTSLNAALHPALLVTAWALTALVTLVGLAAGMLLGFLRSLAWATFGALALAVLLLGERLPRATALNPLELMTPRLTGLHWRVSREALAVQVGTAAAMCLVAGLVFCRGVSGRRMIGLAQKLRRPFLSALVATLTIGVGLAIAVFAGKAAKPKRSGDLASAPGAEFPRAPPGHLATRHYLFVYPGFGASQARALSVEADAAFEAVAALLPSPDDRPIDVDLSGSMPNTAGTAFWNRVRMEADSANPTRVLSHETSHVLAHRIVTERGNALLGRMPVLDEGLAQWISYRAPGGEGLARQDELIAAALFRRHEVIFEELVDFSEFERKRDESLKYPLGAALVRALVGRYGEVSVRRVLETLGREDFPNDRSGRALWQTTFQLAGYDLSAVVDLFYRQLEAWAKRDEATLAALPRLRAAVEAGKSKVAVRVLADRDLPQGARLAVRVRPTAKSDLSEYTLRWADSGRVFIDRDEIANEVLCFQPGLSRDNAMLFEAWRCSPLVWADDDGALE